MLRDLPVAFCWEDIDTVCAYNDALRTRLNTLIQQYRAKPAEPYDFARDILGETIWLDVAKKAAAEHLLDLNGIGPATPENIMVLVRTICDHFRHLVEVKWSKNKKLVHGFETQLEEYAKAEQTKTTMLLVIRVTESETSINTIQALQSEALRNRTSGHLKSRSLMVACRSLPATSVSEPTVFIGFGHHPTPVSA